MHSSALMRRSSWLVVPMAMFLYVATACAQGSVSANSNATSVGLSIETMAERRVVRSSGDGPQVDFVAADELHVGDEVFYTLRVRNSSGVPIERPVIIKAVPRNTVYVAESAVGPATTIEFSIDGGSEFASPDVLTMALSPGVTRLAEASDYTHLRWQLRHPLAAGATALLRFRGVFK